MRLISRELPGTGGSFKITPEDFVVDELPAYAPSGEGEHTFLHIEKRGLTTADAVARLCRALAVAPRDAGVAGQKDRQALTRQWISLPGVAPEQVHELALDGVRVLACARHPHKLRTGHLVGNRFALTLRGVGADGHARAEAVMARLLEAGLPNYFGEQRFGARGDNAARGKLLLDAPAGQRRLPPTERRLLVSAYQAALFNRYLDARIDDGLLGSALIGDIMKKSDTGGLFTVADEVAALADAGARLLARALVVTGPMFGHKMMAPPAGSAAHAREALLLEAEGLTAERWKVFGRLAEGTRRPLTVPVGAPTVERRGDDALLITFTLPSGAYATTLLAEVMKGAAEPTRSV